MQDFHCTAAGLSAECKTAADHSGYSKSSLLRWRPSLCMWITCPGLSLCESFLSLWGKCRNENHHVPSSSSQQSYVTALGLNMLSSSIRSRSDRPTLCTCEPLFILSPPHIYNTPPPHLSQQTPPAAGHRCRAARWAGGPSPERPGSRRSERRPLGEWTASPPPVPPAAPPPQSDPRGASPSSWWCWHRAPPRGPRCRRSRTPPDTWNSSRAESVRGSRFSSTRMKMFVFGL